MSWLWSIAAALPGRARAVWQGSCRRQAQSRGARRRPAVRAHPGCAGRGLVRRGQGRRAAGPSAGLAVWLTPQSRRGVDAWPWTTAAARTVDSQSGRRLRRSLVMAIAHPVPVIRRSRSNMADMARHPTTSRISSTAPRARASASVVGKPLNARYEDTAIEGRLASRLNC